jgi:hypothetical protein
MQALCIFSVLSKNISGLKVFMNNLTYSLRHIKNLTASFAFLILYLLIYPCNGAQTHTADSLQKNQTVLITNPAKPDNSAIVTKHSQKAVIDSSLNSRDDSDFEDSTDISDTQSVKNIDTTALKRKKTAFHSPGTLSPEDSLRKTFIRDSLVAAEQAHSMLYKEFPVSLDSVYNIKQVQRHTIFSSDALSVSDLLQTLPQFVSAPFSLSNSLNRSLPYGFPLSAGTLSISGELIPDNTGWLNGTDRIAATQLSNIAINPSGSIELAYQSDDIVIPETDLLWENGLFYENILNLRFARPLSPNVNFEFFCNNRYFKSMDYRSRGSLNGIVALDNYFVNDTNILCQGGHNPLVREQDTRAKIVSRGKNNEQRYLTIGYDDDNNEISRGGKDSTGIDTLKWDRVFRYGLNAAAGINGLCLSKALLDGEIKIINEGHTRRDLSTKTDRSGRNAEYAVALRPYLPINKDTAAISGDFTRHRESLYNDSTRTANEANAAIAYSYHFSPLGANGTISGSLGRHFLKIMNMDSKNDWTGNFNATIESNSRMIRLFALRDYTAFPLIYDTVNTPFNRYFNEYESYGAELYLTYKKIGLMTGVCGFSGLSGFDSSQAWPDDILPYEQPDLSWVIAPLFGRWHGLSISSRWMFSNERPYLKARNCISYQAHPIGGKEHILVDLALDYWSRRDTLTYCGIDYWNREVINLSLNIAVQVKTFSLFYKIDNILNRQYAYVPGYFMPGNTFRWGFQWLIKG